MSKLISLLAAGSLALVPMYAAGADNDQPTNEEQMQSQESREPADQQPTADLTEREQEYLNALNECESMSGADKERCMESTRKRFGHD